MAQNVQDTYEVLRLIPNAKTDEEKYHASAVFRDCIEDFKDLVQFVSLNIEMLEHIFQKIDKHTDVFESEQFREDFKKNYQNQSDMQKLIEHQNLYRLFHLN